MRPELEQIEKIEKYLNGELSAADKTAFESQLTQDPRLREDLRLHQDLIKGLDRIKQIQSVRRAKQHYYRNTWLKWGGFGLGVIVVTGLIILLLTPSGEHRYNPSAGDTPSPASLQPAPGKPTYRNDSLPVANESGQARWSSADSNLPAQTFWLNASRDTVIETKAGIVLSIPATAFFDANRQTVTGTVELVVKEALDPATILKAGLSTRAGDRVLETGGMFFVDGRKNGQPLNIDPRHAIYAEIPTDSIRSGMQLFTGKRLASGIIDWTNPRPLEHDLLPVDIHLLNFYPPHYLDSVAKWGYDRSNKRFTDSLYFTFAHLFAGKTGEESGIVEKLDGVSPTPATSSNTNSQSSTLDTQRAIISDSTPRRPAAPRMPAATDTATTWCGINPAKIAAIWNDHFQNTLIATREFEQRLILIHQSGDNNLLDLYVNHLDLSLSAVDSIAATRTTGKIGRQFLAFAARRDGKVKHGDTRFDKLREYYQNKAKAFADAVAKTTAEFWANQQQLDDLASSRQVDHSVDSVKRLTRNFTQELEVNIKSACRQLGFAYSAFERPWTGATISAPATYQANITSTGWCNIDRYLVEGTIGRQTIDVRDNSSRKRVLITYRSVHFKFHDILQNDRLYLYLLPDKLSSFMRLTDSAGTFTEKLTSEMTYRLVVIAYKKEQAFYYTQPDIQPVTYPPIPLVAINAADLDSRLQQLTSIREKVDLQKDQEYYRFEYHDRQRRDRNQTLRDLTDKMINAFFSCMVGAR